MPIDTTWLGVVSCVTDICMLSGAAPEHGSFVALRLEGRFFPSSR